MKIGTVTVTGIARLAPMAGISNAPFRRIARACGSGLLTTEELDAQLIVYGRSKGMAPAAYHPDERPLAFQLLGRDPELLALAARKLEDHGADIVDLNMGCSVPKIARRGKGVGLMRDLPHTAAVLRAMRRAIAVPLTIKIRAGWDEGSLNAVEVARLAESEGVDAITVHARTAEQRFSGTAHWAFIREVARAVRIPVTGNGDVTSLADARRMLAETGCQDVMIGRAATGRPWVFMEDLESQPIAAQWELKARTIRHHLALIAEHFDARHALYQTRNHLSWYLQGLPGAPAIRGRIHRTSTVEEAQAIFWGLWEDARDAPRIP